MMHITLLLCIIYLYSLLAEAWGGVGTHFLHLPWPETLLVIYLYSLIYTILIPSRWQPWLAAVPIFVVYLVHDVFYWVYGKIFRIINITELPELLQVLPPIYAVLLIGGLLSPFGFIVTRTNYHRPLRIGLALMPLILLITFIKGTPIAFTKGFLAVANEIVKHSDSMSVASNGRLAMLLYREAEREGTLQMIKPYLNRNEFDKAFRLEVEAIRPYLKFRNIHVVILESFLDPNLFRDLNLQRNPAHPDFSALFGDKLGLSISPVFGGRTAEAEFEVLCGVPSLEQLSSVEFNTFTGASAHCLPNLLAELGYRTVASNPYKPDFFNVQPAYKGAGFSEQQFPEEFSSSKPSYLRFGDPGEEQYIFDGDLFAQNLNFVRRHFDQNPGQPLFNYLVTLYGHAPYILNPIKRPMIIPMYSGRLDENLELIINQFYYRTEAIAHFIQELITIDPMGLIVLVSDHLPGLQFGAETYREFGYLNNIADSLQYNRLAIIESGIPVTYDPIRHFDLRQIIIDSITQGHYCTTTECNYLQIVKQPPQAYYDRYMTLMAHAAE